MNIAFQLLRKSDGSRSPAVKSTRGNLARSLEKQESLEELLVVPILEFFDNEWRVSEAPVLEAKSFVDLFKGEE